MCTCAGDGSGEIDEDELAEAFRHLGFRYESEDIRRLMRRVDSSGDGTINLEEFVLLLAEIEFSEDDPVRLPPVLAWSTASPCCLHRLFLGRGACRELTTNGVLWCLCRGRSSIARRHNTAGDDAAWAWLHVKRRNTPPLD